MKLIICHASAGIQGSDQHWAMRREFLSKQYTTKWSDIPTVKA
ncbi:DUF4113 domain-containing protein [Shewanella xiamenensis]|nr:DUF4113 domain-containing protein [Shewanella xiamenensis]